MDDAEAKCPWFTKVGVDSDKCIVPGRNMNKKGKWKGENDATNAVLSSDFKMASWNSANSALTQRLWSQILSLCKTAW